MKMTTFSLHVSCYNLSGSSLFKNSCKRLHSPISQNQLKHTKKMDGLMDVYGYRHADGKNTKPCINHQAAVEYQPFPTNTVLRVHVAPIKLTYL